MIELGRKQTLKVVKKVEFGVYLGEEAGVKEQERVLLPGKQVPDGTELGDELSVFIYKDSSDRLIATTRVPALELHQTALLTVADVGKIGAFLDWGLEKDLLLPFREQTSRVQEGQQVLVAVGGSSLAEKSGFLVAVMEKFLGGAKGWIVTCVVVFLGINLNVAGDAGNIVLPPLAAVLFMSVGRHPLLGLYTAFASVSAGFCANMILGLSDALAYGFTEPAAQMIDPTYSESIAINWYFLMVSCVVLTITGTILVEKVLVPRFPISKEELAKFNFGEERKNCLRRKTRVLKWQVLRHCFF